MAVFPSYSAVGNREDLLDIITMISPLETPMFSSWGKVSLTNTLYQWQTDKLAAPGANAQQQGFTYSSGSVTATALLTNRTQTFYKGYEVSKTQEAILHAGRASETAYQKEKAMKEFVRDVEYQIVNSSAAVAYSGGVAGQLGGLDSFLTGNYDITSDAINKTVSAALTQEILNDQLQVAWLNGATEIKTIYSAPKQKRVINKFPATVRKMDMDASTLTGLVNVYECDFGTMTIKLDRYLADSVLYCLNDDKWKVGILRPIVSLNHPEVASSYRFGIEGEMGLVCYSPQSNTVLSSIS